MTTVWVSKLGERMGLAARACCDAAVAWRANPSAANTATLLQATQAWEAVLAERQGLPVPGPGLRLVRDPDPEPDPES